MHKKVQKDSQAWYVFDRESDWERNAGLKSVENVQVDVESESLLSRG
jgi:hypothetical protein